MTEIGATAEIGRTAEIGATAEIGRTAAAGATEGAAIARSPAVRTIAPMPSGCARAGLIAKRSLTACPKTRSRWPRRWCATASLRWKKLCVNSASGPATPPKPRRKRPRRPPEPKQRLKKRLR